MGRAFLRNMDRRRASDSGLRRMAGNLDGSPNECLCCLRTVSAGHAATAAWRTALPLPQVPALAPGNAASALGNPGPTGTCVDSGSAIASHVILRSLCDPPNANPSCARSLRDPPNANPSCANHAGRHENLAQTHSGCGDGGGSQAAPKAAYSDSGCRWKLATTGSTTGLTLRNSHRIMPAACGEFMKLVRNGKVNVSPFTADAKSAWARITNYVGAAAA